MSLQNDKFNVLLKEVKNLEKPVNLQVRAALLFDD